jgi:16S rRNA processing protein RimM
MTLTSDRLICVGKVLSPHGIKGQVKIKSFTEDPETLAEFPVLYDGKKQINYRITLHSINKDVLIASISGVNDRTAAEGVKGKELFVERSMLPVLEDEEEFYYEDMIGLAVFSSQGEPIGQVKALHNFGAGDMMEVTCENGKDMLIPFTHKTVPVVDIAGGRVALGEVEVVVAKE